MGESDGDTIFESLNLKPQLFINEVLNSVDDLLDEALLFYHQQASALLKIEGTTGRAEDLSKGVAYLHNMIQSVLDKHLGMWDKYCLRHCFTVPEGFALPESDTSSSLCLPSQDTLVDHELEDQLDSLRNRLITVRQESAKLTEELQALERQTVSGDQLAKVVADALESSNHSSLQDKFPEMMTIADKLRSKILKLMMRKAEETEPIKNETLKDQEQNSPILNNDTGLCCAKQEDLQNFLADLKNF